jgi:hypothetical protein
MKIITITFLLAINLTILKAQTAIYLCDNNVYGYCYGGSNIKTCARNACLQRGGNNPTLLYWTENNGYGALYTAYNYESKLVVGIAGACSNFEDAKTLAYNYCIGSGGINPQLVETWNDYQPRSTDNLGKLRIKWTGVIDNAEGDNCPHGPTGKLYVIIYPGSANCPGNQKHYNGYLKKTTLIGQTSGKFCTLGEYADREWLDGAAMQMNLPIYTWQFPNEEILVVIYESDEPKYGVDEPFRESDMIFCYRISRESTINNLAVLGYTYRPAEDDAIINCRNIGITWYQDIWNGGLNKGIPSIFIQIITE